MFRLTLAVTRAEKEVVPSKGKEKVEEETIFTKCNVTLHHSSFNKADCGKNNPFYNTKERKRDTTKGPKFEDFTNHNSTTAAAELTKCNQGFSGSEPNSNFFKQN